MEGNRPNLNLNMDDKIYLAVSKRDTDKLSFVYTLACLKTDKMSNSYNMTATREINSFRNREFAKLYHDTIEQIIEVNANTPDYDIFFSYNDKLIEKFLEHTK